eukprot:scaffold26892_cov91-Attheya_sp.AAC.2
MEDVVIAIFARRDNKKRELEGWSFAVNRAAAEIGCLPAETKDDFGKLGGFIHTLICKPDAENMDPAIYATLQEENDLQEFANMDNSVLKMFFFKLMTGLHDHPSFRNKSDSHTPHNSAFVCAEMVRAQVSGKPSPFQNTAARILSNASYTSKNQFFSRFNIAVSRNSSAIRDQKVADTKILAGLKREVGDQAMVSLDNLDLRFGGVQVGITHFVTQQVAVVPKHKIEMRINGLSRQRYLWDDVRRVKNITPEMMAPGTKHFTALNQFKCKLYKLVLQNFDKFPILFQMLEEGTEMRRDAVPDVTIGGYGAQRFVNVANTELINTVRVNNMYALNDTTPDTAVVGNLAKKEEVEERLKYCARIWKNSPGPKQLNEYLSQDGDAPAMANGYIYFCVDGAPANMGLIIQAEKPKLYPMVKIHAGGFHKNMNLGRNSNKVTRKLGKEDYVDGWRETPGKKAWYFQGSDPGQHDSENWPFVLGIMYMQVYGYIKMQSDESINEGGTMDISAVDVQDFVLDLCTKSPELLIGEFDLNTVIMGLMFQDAENRGDGMGDAVMFRDVSKLCQMVWAVSNSSLYMRIAEDEAKSDYTMSDSDKAIHDNFVFTRKTVRGSSIYTDRNMEWQQKDTKIGNGSKTTGDAKRDEMYMNRLQMNLDKMVDDRRVVKKMRAKHKDGDDSGNGTNIPLINSVRKSDRPLRLGRPFVSIVKDLHESNKYKTRDDGPITYMSTDESEIKEIKGAHTLKFLTSEYEWVQKRIPESKRHRFPPFNKDWSKPALLKKVVQGRHIIYGVESARSDRQTALEIQFDTDHPVPELDEEKLLDEVSLEFYTGTKQSRDGNKDAITVNLTTQFMIPELDVSANTVGDEDGGDEDGGDEDGGDVTHSSQPPQQFSQASSSGWSFASSLHGSPKRKKTND